MVIDKLFQKLGVIAGKESETDIDKFIAFEFEYLCI